MQRQTNMLNLFVEFGFQLFNMKTLFYFKLRICANLKTRNIALILKISLRLSIMPAHILNPFAL